MAKGTLEECLNDVVTLLKAVGNDRRFEIVYFLAEGERAVGELEEMVGLSQSALSQHLARLRRDGLVTTRRDAQRIYYSIKDSRVTDLIHSLAEIHNMLLPGRSNRKSSRMARSA